MCTKMCFPLRVIIGTLTICVYTTAVSSFTSQEYKTAEHFSGIIIEEHGGIKNSLSIAQFSDLLEALHLDKHDEHKTGTAPKINGGSSHVVNINCTNTSIQHADLPCTTLTQCLSATQLLDLISSPQSVNSSQLIDLCPALLHQVYHGMCNSVKQEETLNEPDKWEVWVYGFLFVTIISLCSLVGVSVIPLMGKKLYNQLLTFLIGLAVGSLSSSAMFHLIPQAFNLIPPNGKGSHEYLWTSLFMMGGVYMFFMMERIMKIIMEAKKRSYQQRIRYSCSDGETLKRQPTTSSLSSYSKPEETHDHIIYNWNERGTKTTHKHEHQIEFTSGQDSAIATVAWMIIFGDGLHNFIDGLSIGAGFSQSVLTGVSISVAVLCEEFPHELGDFAVLLNSGMSMKQAMLYNLLSASTCYLGLIVGIFLGEMSDTSNYIFALAAGMFLYISLVDMVPELNQEAMVASKESVYAALKVLLIQNLGWLTGVVTLFVLAYYNEHINFG